MVRSATEVVRHLKEGLPMATTGFSIDIEDLLYLIPHDGLFAAIRQETGEVAFHNSTGVSTEHFLELLSFYLTSTAIEFDRKYYVQKAGICIGSAVAPVLCDIYLSVFDQRVQQLISGEHVVRIFRYVDDYLVILHVSENDNLNCAIDRVLNIFQSASGGLTFTHELARDNVLQFLDLSLHFDAEHICWYYNPRTKKAPLPLESANSKLVKRANVTLACKSALEKSCEHKLELSFNKQVRRFLSAGYPQSLITGAGESLLQKLKGRKQQKEDIRKDKLQVMPYIHRVSHNIKKVASRYGVKVVFSAPCKLSRVCPMVTGKKKIRPQCSTMHETNYTECVCGVVYSIPLTCDSIYIGQTGRCFNERAREHQWHVKNNSGGTLAQPCNRCRGKDEGGKNPCKPILKNTTFLFKSRDQTEREIVEAFYIIKTGDKCISTPSLSLLPEEVNFLECAL